MPPQPASRPRPRRLSLRARLLLAFLVPLVIALALVGAVATASVHRELVSQVDARLQDAIDRSSTADRGAHGEDPPSPSTDGDEADSDGYAGPGFLTARGQEPGQLGAKVVDGVCTEAGVIDKTGSGDPVDPAQASLIAGVPPDGDPHTIDLGGELGEYRLMADRLSGDAVLVVGLPLSSSSGAVARLGLVEVVVGLLAVLAAALTGFVLIRRTLRPLQRVAGTATRVAELPLASGEVRLVERVPPADTDPHTEVGRVGSALNRLLDHVEGSLAARQASETQVRQFVADASHELRTPLASIRGYAELVRRNGSAVPDDVGHALRRVESEALRMSGLVDDLQLLARLDAGRDIAAGEVDLSAIVVDAVSDAHVAGPRHHWRVDLPEGAVLVPGDEDRLHQVLVNLLANTRAHTLEGTTSTTRLRVEDGWAQLEVIDDGPGIPPELLGTVFERFARGDLSRSRNAGSTGLGLAIVQAVVGAHGGTVSLDSWPGRTAFTVRLPNACLADPEPDAAGEHIGARAPWSRR